MAKLSHLDDTGLPSMVNVQSKTPSARTATARAVVVLPPEVLDAFHQQGTLVSPKGSVFQTAIIAGIMAAKRTGELIPLCHPIGLDNCNIDVYFDENQCVVIDCTASVEAKTGVEMEALVGATMAALTVYDMCKALSHHIVIQEVRLLSKTGGKRDFQLPV
jgi:cyclic pyranopterin monophosphate synthase